MRIEAGNSFTVPYRSKMSTVKHESKHHLFPSGIEFISFRLYSHSLCFVLISSLYS